MLLLPLSWLNSLGSESSGFFGSVRPPAFPFVSYSTHSHLTNAPKSSTATAAETASVDFGCSTSGIGGAYCSKFQAAEAFAFLAWLLLLAYWAILLAFAIIAVNNGQSQIWFSSVTDADFSAGSGGTGGVGGGGVGGAPYPQGGVGYPPQQQQPMMTGTAPPPGGSPPGAPVTGSFYPQQNV